MKTNSVKQKLREGKPSFGSWLAFDNLMAARVLARDGGGSEVLWVHGDKRI